jgi:tetratricopeptide (TPR) repeat protein
VARFKKLKALFGAGARSEQDSALLDTFLKDLADPGLISSLQEEEHRRRRWLLAVAALALGLLLGVGGAWWFLARARTAPHDSRAPARLLASLGAAFARAKEIPLAWTALREATARAPHLAEAWAALGLANLYGGQMDAAERAFRRCAEIDPGNPRGLQGLGDVYFATGEYEMAEEVWLKGGAMRSVARLRLLAGRFAEAAPLFHQLAEKTPDPVYTPVMVEALRAGRLTPELRQRLGPGIVGSRTAATAHGWRRYFAHDYQAADAELSGVLAGDPRDDSARLGRGWCRLKTRSFGPARTDFEAVLKTAPSNYSAWNGLGWCQKAQGEPRQAAAAWSQGLALNPESPEAPETLKGLGLLAFERKDPAQAAAFLSRSLLQDPYDLETRALLEEVLKPAAATGVKSAPDALQEKTETLVREGARRMTP